MYYLFENSDTLETPIECFIFDAAKESFPVRPHWHYFLEIIYMLEGSVELLVDGKKLELSEGNIVLFHPNSVHSIYSGSKQLPKYAVFKFDINQFSMSPNYAPKLRSIFKSAKLQDMSILFSKEQAVQLDAERIFCSCVEEMNRRRYGFDLLVKAELYKLMVGVIRLWNDAGFVVGSDAFTEDNRNDIYNITEYIDANMNHNLKITEIASQCGMSYSYFAKKFASIYGKSCKEYIEEMRLYKAEEFLLFTDFDLNYISQETGFSDCSHMIKSFRRYRGITPKQFRLQHLKNR